MITYVPCPCRSEVVRGFVWSVADSSQAPLLESDVGTSLTEVLAGTTVGEVCVVFVL